jgi:uncharacterized protein (DUF934 family)
MSVLVTDRGFVPDDWQGGLTPLADLAVNAPVPAAVSLAPPDDPEALFDRLDKLGMIVVDFPAFSDGRGFTIARRLRARGYGGRLRARGHLLADQYGMARRVGFDEVEISDDLAARQPEDQWQFRADWRDLDHRSRLRP